MILTSVVLALCLPGCSAPAREAGVQTTVTTRPSPGHPTSALVVLGSTDCIAGTLTVTVPPATSACVQVGSDLVVSAGYQGSGGSWPGPPSVSDRSVLQLVSSVPSGAILTAHLKAIREGTTTVTADFVSRNSPCTPTPCTPIPGQPLLLDVTVVASSGKS
jgi:hypothetical protein